MMFVAPLLRCGELVHVLPEVIHADSRVALVYLDREFVPPQVKAFIETITSWARRELATGEAAMQQLINVRAPATASARPAAKVRRAAKPPRKPRAR
jgi:hypothetical protein